MESSSSSSSSAATEALIQTLTSRGWCFGDVEQVKAIIFIVVQSALHGGSCTVDVFESELVNMDLRSVGGKSLPDASVLRKSAHLQGPKVHQGTHRGHPCFNVAKAGTLQGSIFGIKSLFWEDTLNTCGKRVFRVNLLKLWSNCRSRRWTFGSYKEQWAPNSDLKAGCMVNSAKLTSNSERFEEKPSSSEARAKEGRRNHRELNTWVLAAA